MKKLHILLVVILGITTLSFVSYNSISTNDTNTKSQTDNKITILKGAEKSGYSETNEMTF